MIKSVLALGMMSLLAAPATFAANPPSDGVPTAQLVASFQVEAVPGSSMAFASVSLMQVTVANGQETDTQLDQSADDIVSFTSGTTTITYDPVNTQNDTLPLSTSGTYTATFKRANGESYTSTVTMPQTAAFTSPASGAVFAKADPVTIAWTAPPTSALGLFVTTTYGCSTTQGNPAFNSTYTSVQIPAGYAASCTGAVKMQFDALYANIGTGFGGFVAVSDASLPFSYGAKVEMASRELTDLELIRAEQIAQAIRKGQKTLNLYY